MFLMKLVKYRVLLLSQQKITEQSTKKSQIDDEERPTKTFKGIIKMKLRTYCLVCKKRTNNYGSKVVSMKNKVIRNKPRSSICLNDKSRFMKQKHG